MKNITRIATQGRAHSQEFVQEYHISYGSNGLDYVRYKAPGGEVKVIISQPSNIGNLNWNIKNITKPQTIGVGLHAVISLLLCFFL